jgi:hypothetical protein
MKIELVRNAKGEVLGTAAAAVGNEVPVEAELESGQTVEDVDVKQRDLVDIDALHRRLSKGGK